MKAKKKAAPRKRVWKTVVPSVAKLNEDGKCIVCNGEPHTEVQVPKRRFTEKLYALEPKDKKDLKRRKGETQ